MLNAEVGAKNVEESLPGAFISSVPCWNRYYHAVPEPVLPCRAGTGITMPCWNRYYHAVLEPVLPCRAGTGIIINFAEVVMRLALLGMPENEIRETLDILALDITPFDEEQAFLTGLLAIKTKQFGLSRGDRACLALALRTGSEVLTSDKIWQALDIGVVVSLIR